MARGVVAGPAAEERGLTARLAQRDEAALAEVYDAHAAAVHGLLCRMLDAASAQEVTQDVFLRLWARPGDHDPARGTLRAYLLVLARSRGLDRLRAGRATLPLHAEDGAELPLPDRRGGPQQEAEDAQRRERVRGALGTLSAAHRETVERAYLRGQTRELIAAQMGVPVGTVKSRLSHALSHLKRAFGPGEVEAWLD